MCIMNACLRIVALGAFCLAGQALAEDAFERPPINYSATAGDNPITRLQSQLDSGAASLTYERPFGYLRSLLEALAIPRESQLLVFSKTSLQIRHIDPSSPRAIYFNDDVYVGAVRGGDVLEISTADPGLGAVFYTLSQDAEAEPRFIRQRHNCLSCHGTSFTRGYPGHLVRSVVPNPDGQPIGRAGTRVTDQNTPFDERWGGWYITGTHGDLRHRANAVARDAGAQVTLDLEPGANRLAVPKHARPEHSLTPHSDIVAMMVLEHQTRLHNLLTEAIFETRFALHREELMDETLERAPTGLSDTSRRIIEGVGEAVVQYMIFAEEVEFDEPVTGTSEFAHVFESFGPRDAEGRSLREFDLEERLFTYPLSYLVYSPQFDAMPKPLEDYVYRRLWEIFTGSDPTPGLLHLTNAKCRAVMEILVATKPGLPDYWYDEDGAP